MYFNINFNSSFFIIVLYYLKKKKYLTFSRIIYIRKIVHTYRFAAHFFLIIIKWCCLSSFYCRVKFIIATGFHNLCCRHLKHITGSSIVPFTSMTNDNHTLFTPRQFISPSFAPFVRKESYRYICALHYFSTSYVSPFDHPHPRFKHKNSLHINHSLRVECVDITLKINFSSQK